MSREKDDESKTVPRILVFDIETAGVNAFNADLGYVICFGYKWLGEKKTHCLSITDYPSFKTKPHDDKALLADASKLFHEADGLVAHYGDKFDRPFLQSRFCKYGLPNIPNIKQLDTCKVAWKVFKLSSNRLANLASFLGCKQQKMAKGNGWPNWWMEILKGSDKYQKKMVAYCKQDVNTLEEIALRMRNFWPSGFVNYSAASGKTVCTRCGSTDLSKYGFMFTASGKKQKFLCKKCGSVSHGNKVVLSG